MTDRSAASVTLDTIIAPVFAGRGMTISTQRFLAMAVTDALLAKGRIYYLIGRFGASVTLVHHEGSDHDTRCLIISLEAS